MYFYFTKTNIRVLFCFFLGISACINLCVLDGGDYAAAANKPV